MANREYVIMCLKYLHDKETWKEGPLVWDDHAANRRRITKDALSLLRKQEQLIKNYDESLEKAQAEIKWLRKMMMGQEKVIRCIDCNRRGTYDCPVYTGCSSDGHDEPDDWYCASGERK